MVQKNNSKILRRFGYFNKVFSPSGAPDYIYALVNIIIMKELDLHYS